MTTRAAYDVSVRIQGMMEHSTLPILDHSLNQRSAFTPETLIDVVQPDGDGPASIVEMPVADRLALQNN
jgi:hypothetical protein